MGALTFVYTACMLTVDETRSPVGESCSNSQMYIGIMSG